MVFTREISIQDKIRPGMKSSLRLIISNCLHVLPKRNHPCQKKTKNKTGMNFHPRMWNKEKKMSKHFISGWKFIMSMLLFNFLTHLPNLLAAELEFSKTSVPKLPKNISNATSESAGKFFQYISKWSEAFELLHTLFLRYA